MKFLIIDTTKKEALISLVNGENANTRVLLSTEKHSETLLLSIDKLLGDNKELITNMDAFACVTGPGSFTGIRIGMATTLAMYSATNKPILSGNVFEIVAPAVKNGIVFLVCTSHSYYFAVIKNAKVVEVGVAEGDQIEGLVGKNVAFCLEGEQKLMPVSYNYFETINQYENLVVSFFKNKLAENDFTNSQNFSPFYIQLSQAERNFKKVD